jgi:glycosyltransferase involved in cell wall biosynthesis
LPGGLRIALLDSWWAEPARGSGTAAAISGLAGGLAALGHRVTRIRPGAGRRGRLAGRLLYNLEVPDRLRRGTFDLVVGFDWDGFRHRPDGVPYVVGVKGVLSDEARFERGPARALLAFQARLERRNARRAHRVVVPSRYSRGRLCDAYGLPPERVVVVPEGIDLAAWPPPAPRPASGPPTLLSVARQYPRKNTRALLAALPRVRRAVPEATLRVVGAGPELPALRARAARLGLDGCVTFLGPLPEARVRAEYADARVFCLPSLQEGFGIVFLEAMAAGLPGVAGNAGAVPEVVPDGEAGLLVAPRDPEALAAALVRLLTDRALAARLGAAGRARAEGYDWPRVARRFLEAAVP